MPPQRPGRQVAHGLALAAEMSLIGGRALDGRRETLRAVAFTDRDATGRASSVRLYTDTSPLFAQSAGGA